MPEWCRSLEIHAIQKTSSENRIGKPRDTQSFGQIDGFIDAESPQYLRSEVIPIYLTCRLYYTLEKLRKRRLRTKLTNTDKPSDTYIFVYGSLMRGARPCAAGWGRVHPKGKNRVGVSSCYLLDIS